MVVVVGDDKVAEECHVVFLDESFRSIGRGSGDSKLQLKLHEVFPVANLLAGQPMSNLERF